MNKKVLPFVMALCVLAIFIIIFFGIIGSKEHTQSLDVDQNSVTEATTTEPLTPTVGLSYGTFTFEPLGEHNYLVETTLAVEDIRPFTDKALELSLSAGSYTDTQESDFTGSRVVFDRQSGDFVLLYTDTERGTSSIATIYSRTDYENPENDIKRIRLTNAFVSESEEQKQSFTEAVNTYCHLVEDSSSPTKRYNLLSTEAFDALPEAEQMEYGPFLCGTGNYYVFDTFILKSYFVSDGVRVSDVTSK